LKIFTRIAVLTLMVALTGAAESARAPVAESGVAVTVNALVAAATVGDQARVEKIASELKMQPRPVRGNRRVARDLNDRGLALWQRQRFGEAAGYFRQAHEADASDAEIAENLGYSLLKSGNVAEAEPAILEALALGPERASAWGSLGSIYAKQGKHRDAVACVLTAYRFAPNPKRALDLYSRLAVSDEDPKVRAVLADAVNRLPK
jgi:tetratricopeptide (TPR) repeat protein